MKYNENQIIEFSKKLNFNITTTGSPTGESVTLMDKNYDDFFVFQKVDETFELMSGCVSNKFLSDLELEHYFLLLIN